MPHATGVQAHTLLTCGHGTALPILMHQWVSFLQEVSAALRFACAFQVVQAPISHVMKTLQAHDTAGVRRCAVACATALMPCLPRHQVCTAPPCILRDTHLTLYSAQQLHPANRAQQARLPVTGFLRCNNMWRCKQDQCLSDQLVRVCLHKPRRGSLTYC